MILDLIFPKLNLTADYRFKFNKLADIAFVLNPELFDQFFCEGNETEVSPS